MKCEKAGSPAEDHYTQGLHRDHLPQGGVAWEALGDSPAEVEVVVSWIRAVLSWKPR